MGEGQADSYKPRTRGAFVASPFGEGAVEMTPPLAVVTHTTVGLLAGIARRTQAQQAQMPPVARVSDASAAASASARHSRNAYGRRQTRPSARAHRAH